MGGRCRHSTILRGRAVQSSSGRRRQWNITIRRNSDRRHRPNRSRDSHANRWRSSHCRGSSSQGFCRRLENQVHRTQLNMLTVLKRNRRLVHPRAIHKTPVRRAEIAKKRAIVGDNDFTVRRGHRRMWDRKVVVLRTPYAVGARLELNFPGLRCSWIDEQSVHGC